MTRSNQGGSILGFLIIGGVLTVLLLGGAYYVQQRATPAPATADNKPADKKDTAKTDEEKKGTATPATEAPKQEASQATPQPAAPSTGELPKTGPAETLSSLLGLGLLSGMFVAYVRSRRHSNVAL
jgi:LPXTG-motif cell wall-anchored protein